MKQLGKAKTIGELIKTLEKLPPENTWFGYDDESIIIVDAKTKDEIGFIDNE